MQPPLPIAPHPHQAHAFNPHQTFPQAHMQPTTTYPQHGVHMYAPAVPGIPAAPQLQHPDAHTYSEGQPQAHLHMHSPHALNAQRSSQAGSVPSTLPSYHIPSLQQGAGSVHSMGSATITSVHSTPPHQQQQQQQPYNYASSPPQPHNAWAGVQHPGSVHSSGGPQAPQHAYTTTPPPLPPTMPIAQQQHGGMPADRVKVRALITDTSFHLLKPVLHCCFSAKKVKSSKSPGRQNRILKASSTALTKFPEMTFYQTNCVAKSASKFTAWSRLRACLALQEASR